MRDSVDVLGVGVHPLTWTELLEEVDGFIRSAQPRTIAYANVHVINSAQKDHALHGFLAGTDICYCDGNGVVLGARLLGESLPERMTGADWIWALAEQAALKGWRIYRSAARPAPPPLRLPSSARSTPPW
jgi:N-acetylglucosaminyldiphosphoundecaprenol N-acetyl-beta-D-mannosaminyltransferase